jgi:integrase
MARPSTGQVLERRGKDGTTFALRFRAYGERRYLTLDRAKVKTREKAKEELDNLLADVRRGIWRPHEAAPVAPRAEPTFHVYSSEWVGRRSVEVDTRTVEYFKWALSNHLLPYFAAMRPSEITP